MIDILKYILSSPLTYLATCMCALLVIGLEAIWREVFRDFYHALRDEIADSTT